MVDSDYSENKSDSGKNFNLLFFMQLFILMVYQSYYS